LTLFPRAGSKNAIQTFIASALLGTVVDVMTLVGMIGVMFYLDWGFTLIALCVAPLLFAVVYNYTRRIKQAARAVRKKESEVVSTLEEVLSSIRVVKAFASEDYEQRRFEQESLESVETALKAVQVVGNEQVILLHCTSNYPLDPAEANTPV